MRGRDRGLVLLLALLLALLPACGGLELLVCLPPLPTPLPVHLPSPPPPAPALWPAFSPAPAETGLAAVQLSGDSSVHKLSLDDVSEYTGPLDAWE